MNFIKDNQPHGTTTEGPSNYDTNL